MKATAMSRDIAKLLCDGKPRSAEVIALELNLDVTQVRSCISRVMGHSYVRSLPKQYTIAARGREYAGSPTYDIVRRQKAQESFKQRQADKMAKAAEPAASIVEMAKANRHALHNIWTVQQEAA